MKQATKRFLSMLLALVFLAGAFVIYYYYTKPVYDESLGIRAELYSNREFIERQKEVVAKVGELIKNYNEGEEAVKNLIANALPTTLDLSGLLAQVGGIAKNNGITLKSVSFSVAGNRNAELARPAGAAGAPAASIVKPVGEITIRVDAEGEYTNFKKMIETFETNLRIFEPRRLGISPSIGRTGEIRYSYSLELATYYQVQ